MAEVLQCSPMPQDAAEPWVSQRLGPEESMRLFRLARRPG